FRLHAHRCHLFLLLAFLRFRKLALVFRFLRFTRAALGLLADLAFLLLLRLERDLRIGLLNHRLRWRLFYFRLRLRLRRRRWWRGLAHRRRFDWWRVELGGNGLRLAVLPLHGKDEDSEKAQ